MIMLRRLNNSDCVVMNEIIQKTMMMHYLGMQLMQRRNIVEIFCMEKDILLSVMSYEDTHKKPRIVRVGGYIWREYPQWSFQCRNGRKILMLSSLACTCRQMKMQMDFYMNPYMLDTQQMCWLLNRFEVERKRIQHPLALFGVNPTNAIVLDSFDDVSERVYDSNSIEYVDSMDSENRIVIVDNEKPAIEVSLDFLNGLDIDFSDMFVSTDWIN